MYRFKKQFTVFLLTIFLLGSMAATAMAYCGSAHDSPSMVTAAGSDTHHQAAIMDHDAASKDTQHHNSTGGDSNASNCYDCNDSLCHVQSLVPVHTELGHYDSVATLHIEKDINLEAICPARISQPPRQLS